MFSITNNNYTFEPVLQTVRYCEWGQERLHDLAGGSRQWSQGDFEIKYNLFLT